MATRKIVLSDHKGAFGKPSCVPVCRLAQQEFPQTIALGSNGRLHVSPTYAIPEWCPLEHN